MRVAPFVITTNCTMIRIRNRIIPTTSELPATNELNVSITCPATAVAWSGLDASAERIMRVDAMFKTSRYSVVPSSSEGNTLKSSGLST